MIFGLLSLFIEHLPLIQRHPDIFLLTAPPNPASSLLPSASLAHQAKIWWIQPAFLDFGISSSFCPENFRFEAFFFN